MKKKILQPDRTYYEFELSSELEKHWRSPMEHAETILQQINNGMYSRWFEGKSGMTVIDFGANVGLTSLYFLPACKELHCVEPTPSHYKLLTQTIGVPADYQLKESTITFAKSGTKRVIHDTALGEKEDLVTFATGHSTENKITSPDGWGQGKINVQAKPISYFVDKAGDIVDFCKVDIEGFEIKALTLDELKKVAGKVKTFFVEIHPAYNGGIDENREELTVRFMQAGYQVEKIDYQTIVATW